MTSARARDRRVYLSSHPVLFTLMAATRGRPTLRLGRTVLVHGADAFRAALTRVPLDRTATGTTGGAANALAGSGALFDQQGAGHRGARRETAALLGAAGIAELRPIWTAILGDRLVALSAGGTVDLVPLAAEIAGATAAALLGLHADPVALAAAARTAAATAARAHLPGPGGRRAERSAASATTRLLDLMNQAQPPSTAGPDLTDPPHPPGTASPDRIGPPHPTETARPGARNPPHRPETAGIDVMLTIAAISTTVAALPRAAAWACDDDLWQHAGTPALTDELLRVTAPAPLLPRVAAAAATIGGCPIRKGDRLLLVTRHAAEAHRRDPCPARPAPARTAQLVFGVGPHACPGAGLARAQLTDLLLALAPHRPVVVRARPDRRSALPGWRSLIVRATA